MEYMTYSSDVIVERKKNMNNIGFDILEKTEEEVVLKRVLPSKNGKSRLEDELALPKLAIQYFEIDELEQLQTIAEELTQRLANIRKKRSLRYKIASIFGFSN